MICPIMLHADSLGSSNFPADGEAFGGEDPEDLCIDVDSFYKILDENSHPSLVDSTVGPKDIYVNATFGDEYGQVATPAHEKASQCNGVQQSEWPDSMTMMLQASSNWLSSVPGSEQAASGDSVRDPENSWMFMGSSNNQNEMLSWGSIYKLTAEEVNHSFRNVNTMLYEENSGSNPTFLHASSQTCHGMLHANATEGAIKNVSFDGECNFTQVFPDTSVSGNTDHCPEKSFVTNADAISNCAFRQVQFGPSLHQEFPENYGELDTRLRPCPELANPGIHIGLGSRQMPVNSSEVSILDAEVPPMYMGDAGENGTFNYGTHGFSALSTVPLTENGNFTFDGGIRVQDASKQPAMESINWRMKQPKKGVDVQLSLSHSSGQHFLYDGREESIHQEISTSGSSSHDENDSDIYILEEMSNHRKHSIHTNGKSFTSFGGCTSNNPQYYDRCVVARPKVNDESLTLQVALQDLTQTKSEASPPDGVLAVPLLRHQRIALSWMVQKETTNLNCSGGILADDQGLGKTISTIALILMERAPICNLNSEVAPQLRECETLNLDDEDDDDDDDDDAKSMFSASQHHQINQNVGNSGHLSNENESIHSVKSEKLVTAVGKGRPAAGTLVVCPTSVLRQWAEELHNKVTTKANLSVLVYHGANRTKDPEELAKYDVVLTTYSIVSMEVPRQPLLDQDDDEKAQRSFADHHDSLTGSTSRKRKCPASSTNNKSHKKRSDCNTLECVSARPLARVGWFRVVLDEAQSIKNHRTRVARACWGLRAKRRWCLSGTPIQNAVDDLYSYFRFLRYEPYAIYKSFCSTIKMPIHRNPVSGYKKLQLVLRTIMLRRTKGTLIDGKPIINLPPKTVSLKKVDFSEGERDFYSRLEADSREKFKGYADAGTVKQNYVNILLMLLRLRQACDHPLLVKEYDSDSDWNSSIKMAKQLPKEKLTHLLACLEACQAICAICNDPPEDAVVTICGHVFCSQCICEHLTGDESLCPAVDCRVLLTVTAVFPKTALQSSLSDQPSSSHHSSTDSLLRSPDSPSESSKIKAALDILQSLPKLMPPGSGKQVDDEGGSTAERECHSSMCMKSYGHVSVSEKAIVFSQWTRMLDLLEVPLRNSSMQYRRLDGTMSVLARDKAVKDFNTLPEVSVMIMSLKAASLGLNMVAACHVLLLDLWWNPTTEDQAIDRAHRIGQTRPVKVSRLTVKDTVEDRILALQEKKREMVASAFGEDETGSRQTRLTVEDLRYLFMA